MVNTEQAYISACIPAHYNILNIVVNTELLLTIQAIVINYNILNIVVNTEHNFWGVFF